MAKWREGQNIVMVSTSILGCGLDYGHVCDVIYHGPGYTMMDHYQEDLRAGRDGLECRAITCIVSSQKYSVPQSKYDLGTKALYESMLYDLGTKALYESMLQESDCLGKTPCLYLDGQADQCVAIPRAIFSGNCKKEAGSFGSSHRQAIELPCREADVFDSSPPHRELDVFDSLPPHRALNVLTLSPPRQESPGQELDMFDTSQTQVDIPNQLKLRKRDHISL